MGLPITIVRNHNKFTILTLFLLLSTQLMAQEKKEFLSAKDSEPSNFGWMQGFPPPLDKSIDSLTFVPWDKKEPMTWETFLWENYTDGMLILHKGKVVYERYFSELTETDVHAVMSLTKSFTGILASNLVAEGKIDDTKPVIAYVPELKNSAYADATVREVMDMTTALKYSEDYADPNADIWDFSKAGNPLPKPKDYDGPIGYFEYLETIKKQGEQR